MGESPTEVLLFSIGEPALTNPAYFVRELTRVFGNGAIPIYDSVIQVAEDRDWLSDMLPQESKGESIAEGTDPASIGELPGRPSTYLHDHRIPDDFSEEDMH